MRTHGRAAARFWALGLPLVWLAGISAQAAATGPSTYDEFVPLSRYRSLAEAIAAESRVFVPQGVHVIDNPLVISRTEPLHLHGADRARTILVAKNPHKPLFVIDKAPHVQFASLKLEPSLGPPRTIYGGRSNHGSCVHYPRQCCRGHGHSRSDATTSGSHCVDAHSDGRSCAG